MHYETRSEYQERVNSMRSKLISNTSKPKTRGIQLRTWGIQSRTRGIQSRTTQSQEQIAPSYDEDTDTLKIMFTNNYVHTIMYRVVIDVWLIADETGKTVGISIDNASSKDHDFIVEIKDIINLTEEQLGYLCSMFE